MSLPRIGIILSTTRAGRFGDKPAQWLYDIAIEQGALACELVDLRDYPLPFFGEPTSSAAVAQEIVGRWKKKLAQLDGYIFITAEYNRSITGVLKNALDYAGEEMHKKPGAFVGYGGVGGARAVEQLRLMCVELRMAPTRCGVHIGLEPYAAVKRGDMQLADFASLNKSAIALLDELGWWTRTLKAGRTAALAA